MLLMLMLKVMIVSVVSVIVELARMLVMQLRRKFVSPIKLAA